jgi:hypothetical protein
MGASNERTTLLTTLEIRQHSGTYVRLASYDPRISPNKVFLAVLLEHKRTCRSVLKLRLNGWSGASNTS